MPRFNHRDKIAIPLTGFTASFMGVAHWVSDSVAVLGCLVIVMTVAFYQSHRRQEYLLNGGAIGEYDEERTLQDVEITVTRVSDGDSFYGRFVGDEVLHRFRLRRVDAPELAQEGGREARVALEELLVKGQLLCKTARHLEELRKIQDGSEQDSRLDNGSVLYPVELRPTYSGTAACRRVHHERSLDRPNEASPTQLSTTPFAVIAVVWEKDIHGRYVIDLFLNYGLHSELVYVQEQLVRAGQAWVFNRYFGTKDLEESESLARSERLGLWRALPTTSTDAPAELGGEKKGGHHKHSKYRYDPIGRILQGWVPDDGPMPPWVYRKLTKAGKLEEVLNGDYFAKRIDEEGKEKFLQHIKSDQYHAARSGNSKSKEGTASRSKATRSSGYGKRGTKGKGRR
eukprot:GILI01020722.1.p1 GENE.GILI01020722.1~~GILI01020722.1.p1  ORF type:complete len:399 (-),score=57.45 GILI01020722.1:5-1201(-)